MSSSLVKEDEMGTREQTVPELNLDTGQIRCITMAICLYTTQTLTLKKELGVSKKKNGLGLKETHQNQIPINKKEKQRFTQRIDNIQNRTFVKCLSLNKM